MDRSINLFVNEAFQFAVPAALFIVTGRPGVSATVFGLEWASRLAFLFFGGTVIDRFGAARSARSAWVARFVIGLLGLLAVLLFAGSDAVTAIALAACGVLSAGLVEFGFVANERLAATLVDQGASAEVVQSRLGAVDQAALIGGPAIGGAVLLLGIPVLLAGYSLAMVVGMSTVRFAADQDTDRAAGVVAGHSAVRESVDAVRLVFGHRLLRATMLTAMATNLVLATILSTLASVVGLIYHHDPRTASLITSTGGAVSLLTILLTPLAMRRFGYARCLWPMAVATGAVGVVATLSSSVLLFAALLTVAYLGDSVVAIVLRSVRIRVIPRDRYSALMSATAFACFLPMPFAGFLIGALVGRFGLRFSWVAMGLLALASVAAAWRISRGTKPTEQHEFGGRAALREKPAW
ncbi:MAG: hypothetical protein ACJ74U_13840 [Jatrophihabitantaceae bacterium]